MNTDGYITKISREIVVFRSFRGERKIQAVKMIRAFTGVGLKDALDAVNSLDSGTGTIGGYLTCFERVAFEAAGFSTIESSTRSFNLTPVA